MSFAARSVRTLGCVNVQHSIFGAESDLCRYLVRDLYELYFLLSNMTLWCGARFAALVSALEARTAQGGAADDYFWIDIFSKDQSGHGFHSTTKTNAIIRRC